MGKRTSDFLALAAIASGAGLGLGLTGLARTAPVAQVDQASMKTQVVSGRVMVQEAPVAPTIYFRMDRLHRAVEEARETAAELAREQRDIEDGMERLGEASTGPGSPAGRSLFDRKEAMTEEVAELERELDRLTSEARANHREASERLREAQITISEDKLKERVRYSRGLIGVQDREYTRAFETETTRVFEELAEELGRASEAMRESRSEQLMFSVEGQIRGLDLEKLERLRAQTEELRFEARQPADFKVLFEALEGLEGLGLEGLKALEGLEGLEALEALEGLEDLDLENLRIDIRVDEDEDQRRRRRRRPRR